MTTALQLAQAQTVNGQLANRAIRHATYLSRLGVGEANQVVKFMDTKVFPDLLAQYKSRLENIATRGFDTGVHSTKRLRDMVKSTNTMIRAGMDQVSTELRGELSRIGLSEAQWQAAMLKEAMPLTVSVNTPSLALINSAITSKPFQGKLFKGWFDSLSKSTMARLQDQLNIGLAQGETVDQIMRRIRGTAAAKFTDGVLATTRRHAQAVTRTSITHVTTHAREELYKANEDLIKGVQYLATLDARTTDICASLDGRVFKPTEGPRPPMHINCRSTTVPVVKSWKELKLKGLKEITPGMRSSLNGRVAEKTTFGPWLKGQPKGIQNKVLGPGRADLFRRGKVSIEKFTDDKYRPLSLGQLRTLEKTTGKLPPPVRKPPAPAATPGDTIANMATKMLQASSDPDTLAEIAQLQDGIHKLMQLRANAFAAGRKTSPKGAGKAVLESLRDKLSFRNAGQLRDKNTIKKAIHDALKVDDSIKINVVRGGGVSDEVFSKARFSAKWLKDRISRKSGMPSDHSVRVMSLRGRANYKDGKLFMDKKYDAWAHIHEMGHSLEDLHHGGANQLAKSRAFWKARTKGDKFVQLRSLHGNQFDVDEITKIDRFMDTYMGKTYPERLGATEILSMGLEQMYTDPIALLTRDPEMFRWVVNAMHGAL